MAPKNNNYKRATLILSFLTSLFLSCSSFAEEAVTLQLRWKHQPQFAGFYMAKAKGFYQQANLDVSILAGSQRKIPTTEVLEQRANFGVGNTEVLRERLNGKGLIALAAVFQHSPSVYLTKKESGIRTVRDMIGKRVMMYPKKQDAELLAMLNNYQVSLDQIKQIPTSLQLEDLLEDRVDVFNAYLINEPYRLEELNIDYRVINPRNFGIDFYSDYLFTSKQFLRSQPDIVARFREASIKGWRYALDHPEETVQWIITNYPVEKSLEHMRYELKMAAEFISSDLVEIGYINPQRISEISQTLITLGLAKNNFYQSGFIYQPSLSFSWESIRPWLITGSLLLVVNLCWMIYLMAVNQRLRNQVRLRKNLETEARHLAYHDHLTGLPNRHYLMQELEQVVEECNNQDCPYVLFLDLDKFKEINDEHGHVVGDQLLCKICQKIHDHLPEDSFFARLAGDEFIIILRHMNQVQVEAFSKRLKNRVGQTIDIDKLQLNIGVSIGIAQLTETMDVDDLLHLADQRMYQQKKTADKASEETTI
ncbi:GGDEF domain-containing protein [Pelagibaculum spongiae]|uniref:Thiamine pyrimidine synthase n=1 Tax=Pelagibaculum spongiae TaxID=2080658 RepID=A0A2V1H2P7_9GAMM|nr:GGDEF domain-containing protein [Pelagibaculum spongiae]PVZ72250.1 diguanylate cyclase [Pelagibaculum spongiae]